MAEGILMPAAGSSPQGYAAGDLINDGGVADGAFAQRVKLGFGVDGAFADVTKTNGLPVRLYDTTPATIPITATDTSSVGIPNSFGVPVNGTPTAGSTASFLLAGGEGEILLTIMPTVTGAPLFEVSGDTTDGVNGNWVSAFGQQQGVGNTDSGGWVASATTVGVYRVPVSGCRGVRVRNILGSNPNYTVAARLTAASTIARVRLIGSTLVSISDSTSEIALQTRAYSNGLNAARIDSATGTNATAVKGSAGRLYSLSIFNDSASKVYVKFHNTNGAPTPGSTPLAMNPIPLAAGASFDREWTFGRFFPSGIAYSITANRADGDATAIAAGVVGEILYA